MGREAGPHAVERLGHLGDAAQALGQVVLLLLARCLLAEVGAGAGQAGPVVVGQGAQHLRLDEAAARVVRAGPPTGQGHDVLGGGGAQSEHAGAEGDVGVAPQRALSAADGARQHLDHAGVALQLRHRRVVDAAHAHLGHEARHGGEAHARLAQGREDLLDVTQEERVRPHHEHALALEREAVRVEQVGGAVQCHRGLAGAGAALDDEHPAQRGADDFVLLALDGADDVAHVARPCLAQRGQQRTGTAEDEAVGEQALAAGVAVVSRRAVGGRRRCGRLPGGVDEVLVLEPDHLAPAHGQVAAPGQALGVEAGGPVEGLGHRGAPVDDERLVVGARDGQAPDVEGLTQRTVRGPVV